MAMREFATLSSGQCYSQKYTLTVKIQGQGDVALSPTGDAYNAGTPSH